MRSQRPILGLLLATCALVGCSDSAPPPSMLIITIDTLRADHIGAYGATESRTPNIDALAAQSTLFENAAATMAMTRPSHSSIFTSLYPREHGVVNNAIDLPPDAVTLADLLGAEGWRTAAFVGVSILDADSGVSQGFDIVDGPVGKRERVAADVVPRAVDWLKRLEGDEPFLLWVHLFDPHLDYAPPEGFHRDLDPELQAAYPGLSWNDLTAIGAANGGNVPKRAFQHALGLYRGEVEGTDHWVGQLLDGLEASGRDDETAVVFTADHGESFGQGVYFEHADCLFDSTIRVPMLVRWPAVFEPGERVPEQVSSIDIAPTLLSLAGLPVPETFSGRRMQDHGAFGDRYVLIQHPLYNQRTAAQHKARYEHIRSVAGQPTDPVLVEDERVGLVGRDWRLIRTGEEQELYRLPAEEFDEAADQPQTVEELARDLDAALRRHPLRLIKPGRINDELVETLKALGYGQ